MKRMLINATQKEELRVALVDSQRLYDLDIESATNSQKKANVYKGKITRVEPSLEAAFVDYGAERHGFLPIKEIAKSYCSKISNPKEKANYKSLEGQYVLIQVDKEERGNKGAALTTYISLAGRYLVVMPNNAGGGGISRRIQGSDRQQLKEMLSKVSIPKESGIIARTAGVGRTSEELQWDLNYQIQVWQAIESGYKEASIGLIYKESDIVVRALRDYFSDDIGQVLIDSESIYKRAHGFMSLVMPDKIKRLKYYQDELPLFTRYQIESQIDSAYGRSVRLPSGGELVIDYTEAMVSIDINSARFTKGGDVEETALHTNLEAADEIARQLRLRDIGGLVVIDFIDMNDSKHRKAVEDKIKETIQPDRARVQFSKISKFGLLEMSRQRLSPSIDEASHFVCPRCKGQGSIRSTQSVALSVLRLIEENANKEKTSQIIAHLPVKVATFLTNEKRDSIQNIEKANKLSITLVANETLEIPNYEVIRVRDDDDSYENILSYKLKKDFALEEQQAENAADSVSIVAEKPVVSTIVPNSPPPVASKMPSLWLAFLGLFGFDKIKEKTNHKKVKRQHPQARDNNRNRKSNYKTGNKKQINSKQSPNKKPNSNPDQRQNKQSNHKDNKTNKKPNNKAINKNGTSESNKKEFVNPHIKDASKVYDGRPVSESAVLGAGKAQKEVRIHNKNKSDSSPKESVEKKSYVQQSAQKIITEKVDSKDSLMTHSDAVLPKNFNQERVYIPRAVNDIVRPAYMSSEKKSTPKDENSESTQIDNYLTKEDKIMNHSSKSRVEQLSLLGQSIWYDNINRDMLNSGELKRLILEDDLRGVTSNPSIFEKAIASNHPDYLSYLQSIKEDVSSSKEAFFELAIKDIQDTCDLMMPTYEKTEGVDGMVSLEVSPDLSYNAEKTIEEALALNHKVNKSNLMIKVPGTKEGLIALEQLTYLGLNVNVTLLFSVERYVDVFKAYMRGLLKRAEMGLPVDKVGSVASFFISRIDNQVDALLSKNNPEMMGKVAIANAKLAYEAYLNLLNSDDWKRLKVVGAKPQRLLWASTGTKNPSYSTTLYVDELIGEDTVNTVPPATYQAFKESGRVNKTITEGVDDARKLIESLPSMGIDLSKITEELEKEGIVAFEKSFENLLQIVQNKLNS